MPVASQRRPPFNADLFLGNGYNSATAWSVGCIGDAPVLSHCSFAKKSLTKTDRCAGALS